MHSIWTATCQTSRWISGKRYKKGSMQNTDSLVCGKMKTIDVFVNKDGTVRSQEGGTTLQRRPKRMEVISTANQPYVITPLHQ